MAHILAAGSPLHGLRYLRQQSEGSISIPEASDSRPSSRSGKAYRDSMSFRRRKTPLEEEIVAANAEILDLRSRLQGAEDLAAHRKSLLHAAETENNKLRWRLQTAEKKASMHRAKATAAETRMSQSKELVEVADEKIAGLQMQLDVLEADATNFMLGDVAVLAMEAEAAKANHAQIKGETDKVEAVAHELRSELNMLEAKVAEPVRSLADSCLSRERTQLIAAHKANAKGESELHAQLVRNLVIAENRCRELDEQLLRKGATSSQQSSEIGALSRCLAQERSEMQTLENALQHSRLESELANRRMEAHAFIEAENQRANTLAANGEVHIELAAAEANAARKAAQLKELRSALEETEKNAALKRLEVQRVEYPPRQTLVDDGMLIRRQHEYDLLLESEKRSNELNMQLSQRLHHAEAQCRELQAELIDGIHGQGVELQKHGKAVEVAQAVAAKKQVECDILRASEMQSCELNEQLTQRLQKASAQCREFQTELANSKALEASYDGKNADIVRLQRRLTQQRNDFQTTLSEAHSEFEARLTQQEANAAKLKLGDEKEKHASSTLIKELRAQLAQQRAASNASASQQELQINELTALFSAREKALEDAVARAKLEVQNQQGVVETTRKESQALLSKVVAEVAEWMAQLEAHLLPHGKPHPDQAQPSRERSWDSRVSSSIETENTGLPPEFSMLHSLDSSAHSFGRSQLADDADKKLQTMYQNLQAGLAKQRQAVQNAWSKDVVDAEEHIRATAAVHQELHAQIQMIKRHEAMTNSTDSTAFTEEFEKGKKEHEGGKNSSAQSQLHERCNSEERRMEKLAQEVQLQRQNLQEAMTSRRETSQELLKLGQTNRKSALQKQLIRNLNSLSVSRTSPNSSRGQLLRKKFQDIQMELEMSDILTDNKATLSLPCKRELVFNTSASSEDHSPLVKPLLEQLARQERLVGEAQETVARIAQVAENTKKHLEDSSPELSPTQKSKGLSWISSMRTQVISESDALWNTTITEASTHPQQRDQHVQLKKCYEDLQSVLSQLQDRVASSLTVEADEDELRERHKTLQRNLERHLCTILETQEQVFSDAREEAILLRDRILEAEVSRSSPARHNAEIGKTAISSVLDVSTDSKIPDSELYSVSGFRDVPEDPFVSLEERFEKLQAELEEELRSQLQSHEKDLQDSAATVRALHEELKADKNLEPRETQITSLSGGLAALESQLAGELKQLQSSAELARVDGEQKLQQMYSDLYNELTKQRELTREAMSQVAGGKDERLSAIEAKCSDLQAQAESMQRRVLQGSTKAGLSHQGNNATTSQVAGSHADQGVDAIGHLKSRFSTILSQLSTTIESTRGALQQTQMERDSTMDVARRRSTELEEELQSQRRELQAKLREQHVSSKEECIDAQRCVAELEFKLDRLRAEAEKKISQVKFTGDERLRAAEREADELQAELAQQRKIAEAEISSAKRKRSDVEEAMAKAETAGDLLHASAAKNAALQAQLADQQQLTSSRIANLESQLLAAQYEKQKSLGIVEAKRAELQEQQLEQRVGFAVEAEKAACRAAMLELELTEQKRAMQETASHMDGRLQTSEAQASQATEHATQLQLNLEKATVRAVTELEESQLARKALEVQLGELRAVYSSELHCLQEQRQTTLDNANMKVTKLGELEAQCLALQETPAGTEESLARERASKQELEMQLSGKVITGAAREERQKDEITSLQDANCELAAQLEKQKSLGIMEAKRTELEEQQLEQRVEFAVEAEKAACRAAMLELELTEQKRAMQETVSHMDGRLQTSEAQASQATEHATQLQLNLEKTTVRAVTELEESQLARKALEVQLGELRAVYSSELRCLQEQRQTTLDHANMKVTKLGELEAQCLALQETRAGTEESLARERASKQELEMQLSGKVITGVAREERQKDEIASLQDANCELAAQLEKQKSLGIMEAKRTELEEQQLEQRVEFAVEAEKAACRAAMLELELTEQKRAMQETVSHMDGRLQTSEAQASQATEHATQLQLNLEKATVRAVTELEESQLARKALDLQLGELRAVYSSELRCLQEQRQTTLDHANMKVTKLGELEAQCLALQETRASTEESLARERASKQELEMQLSGKEISGAAREERQKDEITSLQDAKCELAGQLANARKMEEVELQLQLQENAKTKASEESLCRAMESKARERDSEIRRSSAELQELTDQLSALQADGANNSQQTKTLREELQAETVAKKSLEVEHGRNTQLESLAQKYAQDLDGLQKHRQELAAECATLSAAVKVEEIEAWQQKNLLNQAELSEADVESKFNALHRTQEAEVARHEEEVANLRSRLRKMSEELVVHQEESMQQGRKAAAKLSEVQAEAVTKERSTLDALAEAHRETQRCLDLAESKNSQMADQRIDLVTESEKVACRNMMLEAQLSEQEQKTQDMLSRGSDHLSVVEGRAQEFMEDAMRKGEALEAARNREASEIEANQLAKHALEVQLAELRGAYSSEVHCLQEQRQTMTDDASKITARALELEGKVAELQTKRSELERATSNLEHSRREVEAELADSQKAETAESQGQKLKVGKLESVNQEINAELKALRQREEDQALQHQENSDRASQEHKAAKEKYMVDLVQVRQTEGKELQDLRQCESNELQKIQQGFAAELDAFKEVTAKAAAHHAAEMRCQKSEGEVLHIAREEMGAKLDATEKEAEETANKLAELRLKQRAENDQSKTKIDEMQGLVQALKEELTAERILAAELDTSKRKNASEYLAAHREMEAESEFASKIKDEAEKDWQQSQTKILKLENKLSQLRCATSMALKTAKTNVEEIDEMSLFSERR